MGIPCHDELLGTPSFPAGVDHSISRALEDVRRVQPEIERLDDAKLAELASTLRRSLRETLGREIHPLCEAARTIRLQGRFAFARTLEKRHQDKEVTYLDEILPISFALMGEAIRRTTGAVLEDRHIVAGVRLHEGEIVDREEDADHWVPVLLAAFLASLAGHGVHVLTKDDATARIERARAASVLNFIGVAVGLVDEMDSEAGQKRAYAHEVTFAAAHQAATGFLYDGVALPWEERIERPLHFAIVDDVEAVERSCGESPISLAYTRYHEDGSERVRHLSTLTVRGFLALYPRLAGSRVAGRAEPHPRSRGAQEYMESLLAIPRSFLGDERRRILDGADTVLVLRKWLHLALDQGLARFDVRDPGNAAFAAGWLRETFGVRLRPKDLLQVDDETLVAVVRKKVAKKRLLRENEIGAAALREAEKLALLDAIDETWSETLHHLDRIGVAPIEGPPDPETLRRRLPLARAYLEELGFRLGVRIGKLARPSRLGLTLAEPAPLP